MVHTLPPWTSKWRMATIFGQIDQGELAARLGSINTFDRRGDTIWMDDFESSTLKWRMGDFGVDADVKISADTAMMGDSCCKLTAGKGANGLASITRYIHPKILGKIGFEFSFTVNDDTKTVQGSIYHFDGTTEYTSLVTYNHSTSKLQYTDNDAGTVDLAVGYTLEDLLDTFHTMKIVIDSSTKKPVRVMVDENSYDLSAYTAKENAGAGGERIQLAITHISDHAAVKSIYVDNVILTQNEI